MSVRSFDAQSLQKQAAEVAAILQAMANRRRLLVLCKLVELGEANVTALARAAGLSNSATSQHLARMREEGIVTFRRESQTIWYRIVDRRIEKLLLTLYEVFCGAKPGRAGRAGVRG